MPVSSEDRRGGKAVKSFLQEHHVFLPAHWYVVSVQEEVAVVKEQGRQCAAAAVNCAAIRREGLRPATDFTQFFF